ncbi:MAG: tRNA pseudouridine(38-40) synthase TruA [Halobacteriovoraceae bacterium]|nr:tRNA pseudouridine(38-40) synthase TruA [Halobacteriovoraceae bacterium]|tara:strand:+ start:239447 stop:240220 length:774 start_codon:yes stop_codon:yes gene_type:complete
MEKWHYLLKFQYLGFRYHGWQKQPQVKTVQFMLDRTLEFILGHSNFKTLGSSRTDSMVSAMKTACTITIKDQNVEPKWLFSKLNENLPADIKALSLERVDKNFQIINHAKLKTYYYLFSNESKAYPFAAPYMCNIVEDLDIEIMKEGAKLFEGSHHFRAYCYKPTPGKVFDREIIHSQIAENDLLNANFFPEKTFLYTVKGEGFMRHQIRLMMGALFRLGRGEITLTDIRDSLKEESECIGFVAPASGLILGDLKFK